MLSFMTSLIFLEYRKRSREEEYGQTVENAARGGSQLRFCQCPAQPPNPLQATDGAQHGDFITVQAERVQKGSISTGSQSLDRVRPAPVASAVPKPPPLGCGLIRRSAQRSSRASKQIL
jgi:hypothetical protein